MRAWSLCRHNFLSLALQPGGTSPTILTTLYMWSLHACHGTLCKLNWNCFQSYLWLVGVCFTKYLMTEGLFAIEKQAVAIAGG